MLYFCEQDRTNMPKHGAAIVGHLRQRAWNKVVAEGLPKVDDLDERDMTKFLAQLWSSHEVKAKSAQLFSSQLTRADVAVLGTGPVAPGV